MTEQNNSKIKNFTFPINEIKKEFSLFLGKENNNKILFSAPFGTGKTYFLKEFFKEDEEIYDTYHLFPINYQISSNEDVLDLLKFDILSEVIKKNPSIINDNKDSFFENIQYSLYLFFKNNKLDIAKNLLNYIPKIGKPMGETIDLAKKFLEFNSSISDKNKDILIFLDKFSFLSESDPITQILQTQIAKAKNKDKKERKSVLILDDLDRIDPDHIFRLLNIFSTHFNDNNEELPNKFGFDKIILVADEKNIKKIFQHKYGKTTDYSGYIDKFYTSEPFYFNNSLIIKAVLKEILPLIKNNNTCQALEFRLESIINILSNFYKFQNKPVSLRKFLKPLLSNIKSLNNVTINKNIYKAYNRKLLVGLNLSINFLNLIYPEKDTLLTIIDDIIYNISTKDYDLNTDDEYEFYYLSALLLPNYLEIENLFLNKKKEELIQIKVNNETLSIGQENQGIYLSIPSNIENPNKYIYIKFYTLLKKFIEDDRNFILHKE